MRKRWAHPQDFAGLAAGIYAALCPLWTTTTGTARETMIALGIITAAVSVVSLTWPDKMTSEGILAVLGLLFIASPWVMDFSGTRSMTWTAWIVGLVVLAAGVSDLQMTRKVHHSGGVVANH